MCFHILAQALSIIVKMIEEKSMQQAIIGFHLDDQQDWVAKLACGHAQHVRHNPPWQNRPWVMTAAGRQEKLGMMLQCKQCEENPSISLN
jgi:hypothetical protein